MNVPPRRAHFDPSRIVLTSRLNRVRAPALLHAEEVTTTGVEVEKHTLARGSNP